MVNEHYMAWRSCLATIWSTHFLLLCVHCTHKKLNKTCYCNKWITLTWYENAYMFTRKSEVNCKHQILFFLPNLRFMLKLHKVYTKIISKKWNVLTILCFAVHNITCNDITRMMVTSTTKNLACGNTTATAQRL